MAELFPKDLKLLVYPENQEKFSDINNLGDTKITCMRPEPGICLSKIILKQNGIGGMVEWLELD